MEPEMIIVWKPIPMEELAKSCPEIFGVEHEELVTVSFR